MLLVRLGAACARQHTGHCRSIPFMRIPFLLLSFRLIFLKLRRATFQPKSKFSFWRNSSMFDRSRKEVCEESSIESQFCLLQTCTRRHKRLWRLHTTISLTVQLKFMQSSFHNHYLSHGDLEASSLVLFFRYLQPLRLQMFVAFS